jgi:hypothetical protein
MLADKNQSPKTQSAIQALANDTSIRVSAAAMS